MYDFIYALLNQAILLPICADSQDTALTIFSTLNNRGLPLSDADIFKAKIYNNLKDDEIEEIILDNNEEDDDITEEKIEQLIQNSRKGKKRKETKMEKGLLGKLFKK